MTATVVAIQTFPVKGEPGMVHERCDVEAAGVVGDRPKKAPVSLVSSDETDRTRANLVVDLREDELIHLVGSRLRIGSVLLGVTSPAGRCPGTYADVLEPGSIAIGDEVVSV